MGSTLYLAGVGIVGSVGFGLLYVFDRDTANDVAQQLVGMPLKLITSKSGN